MTGHHTGVTEAHYEIGEEQMASCEPMHMVATHGTELCHSENNPMLTDAAEATIHDMIVIFDLFHYSNN